MVNVIWLFLLVSGIVVGAYNGRLSEVTKAAFDGAQLAVEVAIGLIAIMTLWLGIMRLAEAAGFVRALSYLLRPITRFLFPSVPPNHPAMGAMVMNISANILGLGNAATPMGLIAMQELQKLNTRDPKSASDAMCTFLALNTSCITLVPTTILAIRMQFDSANPMEIVGTTIFATLIGTCVAVITDRTLRWWYWRLWYRGVLK